MLRPVTPEEIAWTKGQPVTSSPSVTRLADSPAMCFALETGCS